MVLTNEDIEQTNEDSHIDEVQKVMIDKLDISFKAFIGQYNMHTLRMHNYIKNIPVQVLIDGDSIHKFLQPHLVQQ